ncbi:MAG: cell wall hydrolase [Novosphingobium sp.]|nr:cell wall hydrolase [Novosphingobium sp.]
MRKVLPAALGAGPVLAVIVACQLSGLEPPNLDAITLAETRLGADLAELPGRGGDAPLLNGAPLLPMDEARARNAAVPFYAGRIEPAARFRFSGSPVDLARATECLALAALAEAGPSDPGQRAVIQVVLNRVRHPAFAQTVCGVVFEGSLRRTGCQFTFTCDGSLARRYSDPAWLAARARAVEALNGGIYAPVGNATHYHTDWVFPWWSPKLVKLARVETHLFLRWPGYWGSKAAGRLPYRGGEPDIRPLLAGPDPAATEAALPPPDLPADTPAVTGGQVEMRDASGRANFVVIDAASSAADAAAIARKLCKPDATCRVLGWGARADVPAAFPLPPAARASLQFSFTRDPAGAEIVLYNCDRFSGLPRESCIPRAR